MTYIVVNGQLAYEFSVDFIEVCSIRDHYDNGWIYLGQR